MQVASCKFQVVALSARPVILQGARTGSFEGGKGVRREGGMILVREGGHSARRCERGYYVRRGTRGGRRERENGRIGELENECRVENGEVGREEE